MSLVGIWVDRARFEIRNALRDRRTVMFSMLLPIFLLVIFGAALHNNKIDHTGVTFSQYIVAGLIASGLLYSAFQLLAISIPEERATGTLKRLVGSPMPRSAYFAGKLAVSAFIYIFQLIFLLGLGHFFYNIALPSSPWLWFTLAWASVLGLLTCSLLGIAFSSLAKDGRSAAAMATPLLLFFQFTSGVFFVYTNLPPWMRQVAALFPLKWLAQTMRGVFLPKTFATAEVGHTYAFGETAIILGVWTVAALVLCRYSFRWMAKGTD